MSNQPAVDEHTTTAPVGDVCDGCATAARAARRLPFVLLTATTWTHINDLPAAGDGEMRYFPRAPLTGEIVLTAGGRDVHFSDLEV